MKDLININGKAYAFNITKICDYISKVAGKDVKETEIIDSYNFDGKKKELAGKTVREASTFGNGTETIVYDLLKVILIQVIAFDSVDDISLEELPFGTKLAWNTLINEGFLVRLQNE